ncbi:UNVERIFIED_CONTAM: hypothetical protein Scaly_2751900 [Sesamum calycinum]|uniref:Uncharacterized protein n=1 Tax=Sesamum calycinum TaxID=2727403 RepID=A0AAW2J0I0_9LAMI
MNRLSRGLLATSALKFLPLRQSHIRKSLSLRYPSVITKRSGPKGIAAIESKPIESETAAVGVTGVLLTGSNYQQWRRQQEHHKKERAEISPAAEVATSKPVSGPVGFVDSAIEVVDLEPISSSVAPLPGSRLSSLRPSCEIEEIRKMKIVSPGRFIEPPSVFAVDRQLHANMLLTFSAENPAAVSPIDRIDHPVEVVAKSVVSPDPEPDSGPAFSPVG